MCRAVTVVLLYLPPNTNHTCLFFPSLSWQAYTLKTTVEKNSTLSSTPLLSCDSATLVLRKSVEELTIIRQQVHGGFSSIEHGHVGGFGPIGLAATTDQIER